MTWELFVPRLPPGLNGKGGLIRKHWTKRAKEQAAWDFEILLLAREAGPAPKPPLRLTYTRQYARLPCDLDNAAASLKQPLDALVRSGAIHDDSPDIIAELIVRQVKVARVKDQGIVIKLEPIH